MKIISMFLKDSRAIKLARAQKITLKSLVDSDVEKQ